MPALFLRETFGFFLTLGIVPSALFSTQGLPAIATGFKASVNWFLKTPACYRSIARHGSRRNPHMKQEVVDWQTDYETNSSGCGIAGSSYLL